MSRSRKSEKRCRIPFGKRDRAVDASVVKRHVYGHTEKILRRNRKTWTRLTNKRRRAIDKKAIDE